MPVSFSGPAWGREEVVSLGAPPKLTTGDGYEQMPGTASLIRRNPRASESVLLRKARSFALHKYEAAHGWQPSGNEYSAWGAGGLMEVRCKPPRELAEIGTAWATAALRESKVPPNPMWCPQHCGSRLLTNTVCQALDKGGSVEALDATRVEGAIGLQLSLSCSYDADSAESGEAPPARLLFEAPDYGIKDHPALEREQAWYATELVFLTECRTKVQPLVSRHSLQRRATRNVSGTHAAVARLTAQPLRAGRGQRAARALGLQQRPRRAVRHRPGSAGMLGVGQRPVPGAPVGARRVLRLVGGPVALPAVSGPCARGGAGDGPGRGLCEAPRIVLGG